MAPAKGNSRDNRGRAVPTDGRGEDDGGWKGRGKNSRPGVTTDRATYSAFAPVDTGAHPLQDILG